MSERRFKDQKQGGKAVLHYYPFIVHLVLAPGIWERQGFHAVTRGGVGIFTPNQLIGLKDPNYPETTNDFAPQGPLTLLLMRWTLLSPSVVMIGLL